jgi:hypothetical protein
LSSELSCPSDVGKPGVLDVDVNELLEARFPRFGIDDARGSDDSVSGRTSETSWIVVVNVTLSTTLPVACDHKCEAVLETAECTVE